MRQDIVIVGGGLVGLCAALALQQSARRISILESSNLEFSAVQGLNARSIALSYSSVQIFRALGVWPLIAAQACAIRAIQVSARGKWGVARLRAADYDLEALGYVIESRHLARCLLDAVEQNPEITIHRGASVSSISSDSQVCVGYQLNAEPQTLCARLAILADGALSESRRLLGIDHTLTDFQQSVLISNVRVSKPRDAVAFERFTENGPLAMLPLGNDLYSCIWTHANESAAQLLELDDEHFIQALQQCFGFRLGIFTQVGARFSFPVQRTQAQLLTRDGCFLIGNAANSLHPVAGQGFNLALRDIAGLYDRLGSAQLDRMNREQVDELAALFEKSRLPEQRRVIRYGDGLVALFSNDLPGLAQLRAASLALLDITPTLKQEVVFSGMGLSFAPGTLLRGRL